MNIFVRWGQLNTVHVHSDGNNFTLIRATVHNFILNQSISFGDTFGTSSKGFFSNKTDFHAFDFNLDQMEADLSNNDISQVVKLFVPLKLNMQAILNTDLHLHWSNLSFLN